MGFRATFLKHQGKLACHSEVVLHALDKTTLADDARVLLLGVGNGGSMEIWKAHLGEKATVLGIDTNPKCAELGLPIAIGDPHDRAGLQSALQGMTFDVVVDSTGEMSGAVWPWIKVGGLLIFEGYEHRYLSDLAYAAGHDVDTWIPYEEIMCVTLFPQIAVVEKRNPRVVPYLDIIVGEGDPVVPESVYTELGAKRVTVPPEVLEKL